MKNRILLIVLSLVLIVSMSVSLFACNEAQDIDAAQSGDAQPTNSISGDSGSSDPNSAMVQHSGYSLDSEDATVVYFGSYPQTEVTDSATITALNKEAGNAPTKTAFHKWTQYSGYTAIVTNTYKENGEDVKRDEPEDLPMFYQDVTYQTETYRGVIFLSYRPFATIYKANFATTYQDNNGYALNKVYWFKYEPIKWRILKKEGSKATLVTDCAIDSQEFYPSNEVAEFLHDTNDKYSGGYANNYELSTIRDWLNTTFYNTAFSTTESARIVAQKYANDAASMGVSESVYASKITDPTKMTADYVTLLSKAEAKEYLADSDFKTATGSDYAKIQGLKIESNGNARYWLRSPYAHKSVYAQGINADGKIGECRYVYYTHMGVRPMLIMNM